MCMCIYKYKGIDNSGPHSNIVGGGNAPIRWLPPAIKHEEEEEEEEEERPKVSQIYLTLFV